MKRQIQTQFSLINPLKLHLSTHIGVVKRDICDYSSAKKTVKAHIPVHTIEKRFKCDLCNYKNRITKNMYKVSHGQMDQ